MLSREELISPCTVLYLVASPGEVLSRSGIEVRIKEGQRKRSNSNFDTAITWVRSHIGQVSRGDGQQPLKRQASEPYQKQKGR